MFLKFLIFSYPSWTTTESSLIKFELYIIFLVQQYLLLENVSALLSKKHIQDYEILKKYLQDLGYTTYTTKINAFDHGSLQKRVRVFAVSIHQEELKIFKSDEEFSHYIKAIGKRFKLTNLEKRKEKYFQLLSNNSQWEIQESTPKNTPSRIKMKKELPNLMESKTYLFNTLTTKQDRMPNIGMIKLEKKRRIYLDYRFITPREAYKIMGFSDEDFDKLQYLWRKWILNKESLYRQAGNSIDIHE